MAVGDLPALRKLRCDEGVDASHEFFLFVVVMEKARKKMWPVNSPQQHVHVQVPTTLGFSDAVRGPATPKNAFPEVPWVPLPRPV